MNKLQAILIAGLLSLSSVSFASTFNFAAYADNDIANFAGATDLSGTGEAGYETFSATNDGTTVSATGSNSDITVTGQIYAYLDSDNAGLGVCSTGLADTSKGDDQCFIPADDNVTSDETLTLTFSNLVSLDSILLRNAAHGTTFGVNEMFAISVDGAASESFNLKDFSIAAAGITFGKTFDFINLGGAQFYIDSLSVTAVPVPAAGILFASALFGAGVIGRRKKKQASVVGAFARAS